MKFLIDAKMKTLSGWKLILEKTVGGLEWIGFSRHSPSKLLCISSQKCTVIDCSDATVIECDVDYDENLFVAICDQLPNEEISIAGQYGGALPLSTVQGEHVTIKTDCVNETNIAFTVTFTSASKESYELFRNYGYYACGFSYDGNYFVFAQDAGITILQRV